MGDRGNVRIVSAIEDATDVYFYTHWYGSDLQTIVAAAIASPQGQKRWDDESYLNRIIFEEMLKYASDKETGFGIASYEIDSGSLVIVNHKNKTMTLGNLPIPFASLVGIIEEMAGV